MKILVTGSTGMVGKNILEYVGFQKHELICPTRKELDLFNYENTLEFFKKSEADLVLHCAARVGGIHDNIKHPVSYLIENLNINKNVILAARETQIKKLINIGSSCMYPKNMSEAMDEECLLTGILEPTNEGYAIAKITAQRLCQYIAQENQSFIYKTIIPCNLYGKYDNFSEEKSHLVAAIINKIHKAKNENSSEVEIWGDGNARREFLFAEDLVEALLKASEEIESLPNVMNIGPGEDLSINEYYETCAKVINYSGRFTHDLTKPTGMKRKLTSVKKAHLWGWKSKTSLAEGVKKTYQYFLKSKTKEI